MTLEGMNENEPVEGKVTRYDPIRQRPGGAPIQRDEKGHFRKLTEEAAASAADPGGLREGLGTVSAARGPQLRSEPSKDRPSLAAGVDLLRGLSSTASAALTPREREVVDAQKKLEPVLAQAREAAAAFKELEVHRHSLEALIGVCTRADLRRYSGPVYSIVLAIHATATETLSLLTAGHAFYRMENEVRDMTFGDLLRDKPNEVRTWCETLPSLPGRARAGIERIRDLLHDLDRKATADSPARLLVHFWTPSDKPPQQYRAAGLDWSPYV